MIMFLINFSSSDFLSNLEHVGRFEAVRQLIRWFIESDFLNGRISSVASAPNFGFIRQ